MSDTLYLFTLKDANKRGPVDSALRVRRKAIRENMAPLGMIEQGNLGKTWHHLDKVGKDRLKPTSWLSGTSAY